MALLRLRNIDLSRELGIRPSTITSWTQGVSLPNHSLRDPLARLLEIAPQALFNHQQSYGKPAVSGSLVAQEKPKAYRSKRMPTRMTCESYFAAYLDLAEQEESPENFPFIFKRLQQMFPFSDFDNNQTSYSSEEEKNPPPNK